MPKTNYLPPPKKLLLEGKKSVVSVHSEIKPSETTDQHWLYGKNTRSESLGKWMIRGTRKQIDDLFALAQYTDLGEFVGYKASTSLNLNPHINRKQNGAIILFYLNSVEEEFVKKQGQFLIETFNLSRPKGRSGMMSFKTNEATRNGEYGEGSSLYSLPIPCHTFQWKSLRKSDVYSKMYVCLPFLTSEVHRLETLKYPEYVNDVRAYLVNENRRGNVLKRSYVFVGILLSASVLNKYGILFRKPTDHKIYFSYEGICSLVAKTMQWKYTPKAFDSEFTVWTHSSVDVRTPCMAWPTKVFSPEFFTGILYRQNRWYGTNGWSKNNNGRNGYISTIINTYDAIIEDWGVEDSLCVPNIKNTLSVMRIPNTMDVAEPWQNYVSKNVCFLDVETTGLSYLDCITTAVVYSDKKCFYFVKDVNLHRLPQILKQFDICVTYYGRHFDIHMYENEFGTFPIPCHIDLERIYGKIGFRGGSKGGLKGLEDAFLPPRMNEYHITGSQAPGIWEAYTAKTDPEAAKKNIVRQVMK